MDLSVTLLVSIKLIIDNWTKLILKVYDLDDCTESEYTTTARQQIYAVKTKKPGQVHDDDEEVFEKDDFEDYSQTISNYLNSIENQQQQPQQAIEFSFVNPWNREPLQSMNSLDLDEYRQGWERKRKINKTFHFQNPPEIVGSPRGE